MGKLVAEQQAALQHMKMSIGQTVGQAMCVSRCPKRTAARRGKFLGFAGMRSAVQLRLPHLCAARARRGMGLRLAGAMRTCSHVRVARHEESMPSFLRARSAERARGGDLSVKINVLPGAGTDPAVGAKVASMEQKRSQTEQALFETAGLAVAH